MRIHLRSMALLLVTAALGAMLASPSQAQSTPPPNCTASQSAAVQCFVANAVSTGLTQPRYGMTLAQFQDYGVAVTKILQTDQTYLVLVGLSSAIADALPPKNADGTYNEAAQGAAIAEIVAAAATSGFVWPPSGTDLQDLQWFTQDLVAAMNVNQQVLQILTPGVTLRIIDSYVITATGSDGTVNWPQVNSSLSTLVDNFIASGLVHLTPALTTVQIKSFASALAQIIYNYKTATNRVSL
ncbi:MAG: hypothetical protein WAL95_01710 [Candidatus Acidiferrales bacterium]